MVCMLCSFLTNAKLLGIQGEKKKQSYHHNLSLELFELRGQLPSECVLGVVRDVKVDPPPGFDISFFKPSERGKHVLVYFHPCEIHYYITSIAVRFLVGQ